MARLHYRYLLPLGHLLVDVLMLANLIWEGQQMQSVLCDPQAAMYGPVRGPVPPVWRGPPPGIAVLVAGTLPAGLVAHGLRPDADVQDCHRVWDPAWFSIHESVALLFWFVLGGWLDSPGAPLRKLLGGYLTLRFAHVLLCWVPAWSAVGARVETLFWLVFCICALVQGCLWLLRRLRTRT